MALPKLVFSPVQILRSLFQSRRICFQSPRTHFQKLCTRFYTSRTHVPTFRTPVLLIQKPVQSPRTLFLASVLGLQNIGTGVQGFRKHVHKFRKTVQSFCIPIQIVGTVVYTHFYNTFFCRKKVFKKPPRTPTLATNWRTGMIVFVLTF